LSFDNEWASVRGDAAQNVSMQLNHVDDAGGGSGSSAADLSVNEDHLGAIGSAAYDLHTRLTGDGNTAEASTSDAATMMKMYGFRTGGALTTVHDNWKSQVETLLDACADISNHLNYTAASHAKEEKSLKTAFTASQISQFYA
jgi:hypothetical protein